MGHAARLAFKQLRHNRVRLLVAVAGIAFADLLMFLQVGFRDGLFRAAVAIHEQLDADLAIVDTAYENMFNAGQYSRRLLESCLAHPQVEGVAPLYVGRTEWRNPVNGRLSRILVMGLEPSKPTFLLPEIKAGARLLQEPDNLLFDLASRPRYGPIAEIFAREGEALAQLNHRRVRVVGLVRLGKPFDADGDVLASDVGFLRLFPERRQGVIDIGLVRLRPGARAAEVREDLSARFAGSLDVLTKRGFVQREYDYWNRNAPIGFIFNLGAVMGFIVGIVIVYQVLFTDVAEHLPEYATLKAMGYSDGFLFAVVGCEALALAVAGFVPGFLVSWGLYRLTSAATSLPIWMTPALAVRQLLLTVAMCAASGAVALLKVKKADPAEVF